MNIGLIDVDGHNWPNLALMKISGHHKSIGDTVTWWNGFEVYDIVYMSKIFDETYSGDMPEPDGVPRITQKREHRSDRLKCLGNAVVPQQFYPIFEAIMQQIKGGYTDANV